MENFIKTMEMFSTLRKPALGMQFSKALKTTIMAAFTFLLAFSQSFAQNYGPAPLEECPTKEGVIRYALGNSQFWSHGLYFLNYYGDDRFATYEFQAGSYMDVFTGGNAVIKGTVKTTKNSGTPGEWKVVLRFKHTMDTIFKVPRQNPPESIEDWRNFDFLADKSFMYKTDDKNQKILFRPMPRTERDGGVGAYTFQVGTQAAVLADGYEPGAYGASTWFEYSNDHGQTWKQGDINVILYEKCNEVKPVIFEGVCSERPYKNAWKLTNPNKRWVKFIYEDENGVLQKIGVRPTKDGMPGMKVFYTSRDIESITLKYAIAEDLGTLTATANSELCDYKDLEMEPVCTYNPRLRRWKIRNHNKYGLKVQVKVPATGEMKTIHVGGTRGKVEYRDRYFTVKAEQMDSTNVSGKNEVAFTYFGANREEVSKTLESNNEICEFEKIAVKGYCDDSRRHPRNRWVFTNENDYNVWVRVSNMDAGKGGRWIHIPKASKGGRRVIHTPASINELKICYGYSNKIVMTVDAFPCKPELVCTDEYRSYYLSSFSDNGHSLWLKAFQGSNRKLHFKEGAYLVYQKDYENGFLYAELETSLMGETGWKVYAKFVEAGDNVVPKYEKGGKNPYGNSQRDLEENWDYLLFEKGYVKNADGSKVIELCAMPNNYGFQIGYSASGKNWEFGASTWFHWKYDGQKNQGDFNLTLTDACILPEICDDKFGTYKVSSWGYGSRGHSLVLTNFSVGGTQRLHFTDDAYFVYDKMNYATGFMTGTISNEFLGQTGWTVKAYFKEARDGVQPKYEKGGKNGDGLTQRDLEFTWNYLDFDYGILESPDGSQVVKLSPMNVPYGMQIGPSASGKNWEYGASTWIHWEYNGIKGKGDFNVNLENICEEDEDACTFTITEDNGKVGDRTMIILAEKDYCGPAWYTIICPQTGESNTYQVHVGYGKANARQGFSNLKSDKTYIMKLRTKKKVYKPIRFIKG